MLCYKKINSYLPCVHYARAGMRNRVFSHAPRRLLSQRVICAANCTKCQLYRVQHSFAVCLKANDDIFYGVERVTEAKHVTEYTVLAICRNLHFEKNKFYLSVSSRRVVVCPPLWRQWLAERTEC